MKIYQAYFPKKRTTLQLQFEELGINPEGVNRTKSKELRNAIRNHFYGDGQVTTHQTEIKIDGKLDNEDNRKKIGPSSKISIRFFMHQI